MKKILIATVLMTLCIIAGGCQGGKNGYKNPHPFNNDTMGVLMIDQSIKVKSVDGLLYNESRGIIKSGFMHQNNLILTAGKHAIQINRESIFFQMYAGKNFKIEFTVDAGQVYRLMPYFDSGKKTAGIFHEDILISFIRR